MPQHDFTQLYEHYPEIIEQMPETFTSHEFILCLAQRYQQEYVEALYAYRTDIFIDRPAPFLNVHRILSQQLREYPELVKFIRHEVPSQDIFGQSRTCSEWRRLN